ncbi:alpha/beta fold hydrolase [Shewanella phaeophyticola]|uniref:Alpha/beta hydrolase n=1 Tax=Shewanella phaeophyticola TaxID=2978345 RepID=A0ABT2P591_9GAMM|nr:alpha/beta hydrolase [Shewanella sp. KJ10-1]MCT8987079.1 alpha/beta hydrolase [Shewanella sp. KJ10-1]
MTEPFNINQFNCSISGSGQALVWAHGLCGCMQSEDAIGVYAWHRFPKKLQLIRYDAVGHGLSDTADNVDDYLWSNLAQNMLSIAQHYHAPKPFMLGGQSMGCASSLFAALAKPDNVKGLVLMTPPVAWQARAEKVDYYHKIAKAARILGGKGLAQMNAKHLDKMLPSWIIDAHKHSVLGMLDGLKSMKRHTLNQLFTAAAHNDLPSKQQLATISIPTLILAWQGDEAHPVATAKALSKALPNSTLHVASKMNHVDEWPELISEFCLALQS